MLGILLIFFSIVGCSFEQDLEFINNSPYKNLYRRNYSIFTDWLDCSEKAAVLFHYIAKDDVGNFSRYSFFTKDPLVDKNCQQNTANAYGGSYDRGHMVPANHLTHSLEALKESNYITNIMPQTAVLNRQAWYRTEDITECWRYTIPLKVIGGIIMGNNATNDIFVESHGVRTPDWFWKIIEKQSDDRDVIAWIMPNDDTAVFGNTDKYLTTIKEIERFSGFVFTQFTEQQKNIKKDKSWPHTGCYKPSTNIETFH